jgi:hypothetical protein
MNLNKSLKKEKLQRSIDDFLQKNFLDIQGITASNSLDESYLARILTKLAVSSATVWWSILEVKQFINLRKNIKGN